MNVDLIDECVLELLVDVLAWRCCLRGAGQHANNCIVNLGTTSSIRHWKNISKNETELIESEEEGFHQEDYKQEKNKVIAGGKKNYCINPNLGFKDNVCSLSSDCSMDCNKHHFVTVDTIQDKNVGSCLICGNKNCKNL